MPEKNTITKNEATFYCSCKANSADSLKYLFLTLSSSQSTVRCVQQNIFLYCNKINVSIFGLGYNLINVALSTFSEYLLLFKLAPLQILSQTWASKEKTTLHVYFCVHAFVHVS